MLAVGERVFVERDGRQIDAELNGIPIRRA
jgi:hypothetical protein